MTRQSLCFGIVLIACAPSLAQEVRDLGTIEAIHQETREKAGVRTFHLLQEGDLVGAKEECVARVEPFGMNGESLGNLEIRWPDAETKSVTFVEAGSGNVYYVVGHDDGSPNIWMEFEDQVAGEKFTIRHIAPPKDRRIYRSHEEAMAAIDQRKRQSQWVVEGSSMSHSEIELRYQGTIAIISMMVLEVETALGIAPGQQKSKH